MPQKKNNNNNFGLGPKISQLNFWVYNLHKKKIVFIKHKRKLNFLIYSS